MVRIDRKYVLVTRCTVFLWCGQKSDLIFVKGSKSVDTRFGRQFVCVCVGLWGGVGGGGVGVECGGGVGVGSTVLLFEQDVGDCLYIFTYIYIYTLQNVLSIQSFFKSIVIVRLFQNYAKDK